MSTRDIVNIAAEVDRLVLESRFRDLALIAQTDRSDRVQAIAAVLARIGPGAYLVGAGPYSCGILPLTVDEVVLGRPPTPLESIPDSVADFTLNDAVWMLPREASRIHASILRKRIDGEVRYYARDNNSRGGTFVNAQRIGVDDDGTVNGKTWELTNGDVLSLGPSGVNSYVFFEKGAAPASGQ